MHHFENLKRYQIHLKSIDWKVFRKKILLRDNNKCIICGSCKQLQVHHKQYHFSNTSKDFIKPWEYQTKLLITICNECHDQGHKKFKVPIKYIR
tara:strand:- start:1135 stop:1416 length:282 start_codon:yes stop_codon:yes gene_type:complete